MKKVFNARGFTLIELLTVIAIIVVLASIIFANLTTARQRSRDAKRISDIKNIELALAVYYQDNDCYPNKLYATPTNKCNGSSTPTPPLNPTYLSSIPLDPLGGQYSYAGLGSTGSCISYHLGASLEQTTNTALNDDSDSSGGTPCNSNIPDFNGRSAASGGSPCGTDTGSPEPGGSETCYDVNP